MKVSGVFSVTQSGSRSQSDNSRSEDTEARRRSDTATMPPLSAASKIKPMRFIATSPPSIVCIIAANLRSSRARRGSVLWSANRECIAR